MIEKGNDIKNIDSKTFIDKAKSKLPSADNVIRVIDKSSEVAGKGLTIAKDKTAIVKEGVKKTIDTAAFKGKETQKAILTYIDKKKNAGFLDAKLSSFRDGLAEGKYQAVDYIKKHTNFCLAATALSFFFARCDGNISDEEMLEIQFDLDSIIKNKDLPEELRNKLAEISLNEDLGWNEVKGYLDGVSNDTLLEFGKDIQEIIMADGTISQEEKVAKELFDTYLNKRLGE